MAVDLTKDHAWIVDPSDANYPDAPTTALIDFQEGCDRETPGFFLFGDIDFGDDPLEVSDLNSYGRDGNKRVGKGRGDRIIAMTLGYTLDKTLSDEDAVQAALADIDALKEALDREGMFAFQLKGSANVVFFDYKESPLPEIFRGGANALSLFLDAKAAPDGVDIDLTVYPWPRRDRVTLDPFTVDNSTVANGRAVVLTNPGNRESEFRLEMVPDDGLIAGFEVAFRTEGDLTEWATLYASDGDDWVSKLADTVMTLGVAHCDFSTEEAMERRFRDTRIAVDPTALEGTHLIKIRLQSTDATTATEHRIRGQWGFSGDDYAQESGPTIPLHVRDLDTPDYVEIKLGYVTVPKGATRLDIDVYLSREEGDGELDLQQIILVPASVWNFGAYAPGIRGGRGEWGAETFDAEELIGTGAMKFGLYRLNANTEYARTIPGSLPNNGGRLYPAGIHAFQFIGSAREPTKDATDIAVFEVVGNDAVTRKYVTIRSKQGRLKTFFRRRPRNPKRFFAEITAGDVAGGVKFFMKVVFSAATLAGRRIDIERLRHSFVRTATVDTPLVLDTFDRRAYVMDGDGVALFPLVPENEWPLCPPNDFGMLISVYDAPKDPGYEDFDEREVLTISETGRTTDCSLSIWPRRIGLS